MVDKYGGAGRHWLVCRVEKLKNLRRNIFRVGKNVYVLEGLKKVV